MDINSLKKYKEKLIKNKYSVKKKGEIGTYKTEDVIAELENMIRYITQNMVKLGYDYDNLVIIFDIKLLKPNYLQNSSFDNDFVCINMHDNLYVDGKTIDKSVLNHIDSFQIINQCIDQNKFISIMNNLGYGVAFNEHSVNISIDFSKCHDYENSKINSKKA